MTVTTHLVLIHRKALDDERSRARQVMDDGEVTVQRQIEDQRRQIQQESLSLIRATYEDSICKNKVWEFSYSEKGAGGRFPKWMMMMMMMMMHSLIPLPIKQLPFFVRQKVWKQCLLELS